jgi:hypothetical protein
LNQDFSYVRSDLSTAYNRNEDQSDTPNRKLEFFYRNFLYLRASNLFVVYDQVKAKPSSNPKGAYKKHIRWHLPNMPAISGRKAELNYGQSRLFIDTVLPANANLNVVDEWTNPDPCDGSDAACIPFGLANAGTFRIEVRDPQNPLSVPFLTVLQPGSNTSSAPTNTEVASLDGKMIGVEITQAGGAHSIALFNNQAGQVPPPITSTAYNFPGSGVVSHTLMGVVPGALYSVVLTSGVVQVDQSPTGNKTASPAGVLHFTLSGTFVPPPAITSISPNAGPTAGGQSVTITGTNLSTVTSVTFGGTAATITANTATSITVTTPPHAAGSVTVVVATAGGTATSTGGYTFTAVTAVNGDANGDQQVTASDIFYLINFLFTGGPPPIGSADVNADGQVTASDIFYLINFLFLGGPPPA